MNTEHIIGIHLLLPESVGGSITQTKKRLGIEYIKNHLFLPHITLYVARFPEDQIGACVGDIQKESFEKFVVQFPEVMSSQSSESDEVFLALRVAAHDALTHIHKRITTIANEYRGDLIRTRDLQRIEAGVYTPEEIAHIKSYGYLRVHEYFEPHVTLGLVPQAAFESGALQESIQNDFKALYTTPIAIDMLEVGLYLYDNEAEHYLDAEYNKTWKIPLV